MRGEESEAIEEELQFMKSMTNQLKEVLNKINKTPKRNVGSANGWKELRITVDFRASDTIVHPDIAPSYKFQE